MGSIDIFNEMFEAITGQKPIVYHQENGIWVDENGIPASPETLAKWAKNDGQDDEDVTA